LTRQLTKNIFIGFIFLATQLTFQSTFSQNILNKAGISTSVPLSAAYSLRLLSTGYPGNAIQVRRSSDNATQNIGFTASGDLDTAALKAFTGSNSAFVVTWYDQSGNAKNLSQADPTHQPSIMINGTVIRQKSMPFIQFNKPGGIYNSLQLATEMTTVGHVSVVHRMAPGSLGFILGHVSHYYWHSAPSTMLIESSLASASVRNGAGWTNGVSSAPTSIPWPTVLTVNQLEPAQPAVETTWDNIGRDRVYHQTTDGGYSELIVFPNALSVANRSSLSANQVSYFLSHSTLPVTWQSFTAQPRGANVLLAWQTAAEQNVKEYIVQHSTSGNAWTNIAGIPAAGSGSNTYSYTHSNAADGNNYYRILQTDQDGRFSYSGVRMVNIHHDGPALTVLNNPVNGGRMQLQVNTGTDVFLYDAAGKLVWKKYFTPGTHTINTSNYLKGMYMVKGGNMIDKILIR
jgi:hypothetical protein